jgi:hypothetical protein
MHSLVSLPKKCSSVWVSGHGYVLSPEEQTISMRTRTQNTIKYDGTLKVFHLSMAGMANVTTEMGIIYKMFESLRLKSDYLTPEIVKLLQYRSTEYATLTWLVHQIYSNQYDKCQENMVRLKLEELKKEMLVLEQLADIAYARFSPPTIVKNPHSNKVYSLKPNPNETIRRAEAVRSGFVRLSGYPPYNLIWALYGIYIFDTSDEFLAYFSISNLPVDEHGFVDPREIIKRNLLTPENYAKLKHWLNQKDFSGVPDSHVSDIDHDPQTSFVIFKKFCKKAGVLLYYARKRKVVLKHPVIEAHIETLRSDVMIAANTIKDAIQLVHDSANVVSVVRAEFKRTADLADKAEEKHKVLLSRVNTRFDLAVNEHVLRAEYDTAEAIWQEARNELVKAKANDTLASENAQQVEKHASEVIIDAIKKCIDDIIRSSEDHAELKRILKNIIMSNKLRNILKMAILNKKISLKQIILFFSGLEHWELGIADPACSVIKPLQNPQDVDATATMQIDTQQLDDPSFVLPPLFEDILDFIDTELYRPMPSPKRRRTSRSSRSGRSSRSSRSSRSGRSGRSSPARHASPASHTSHLSGGAKRKHRMRRYSRKRRTRRRRYTRRCAS